MENKICTKCKIEKPLSEFNNHKCHSDGKASECKECKKLSDKKYRESNLEKVRAYDKFRNERDKEKRKISKKEYYEKNKEYLLNKNKENKIKNKEYYDSKKHEYNEKYKPKKKIKDKEYREKNIEKIREYKRLYFKEKYNTDIEFNILFKLRRRVWVALKNADTKKNEPIKKLLGCSVLFLKEYLQQQFKPGMSWENYGEWEIDHIIPCAAFDLKDEMHQKECFHYSNLQPLWKNENRAKGAKIA